MSEFFHMGGYAVYVWTAYGTTVLLLLALIVWTYIALKIMRPGACRSRVTLSS